MCKCVTVSKHKVIFFNRCLFSDGSGECMLFCGGKLVKTVLNLSQLDLAGSGQLVYNRQNRFTQKVDLPRQEGVCFSMASPCFASPLKLLHNEYCNANHVNHVY